MEQKLGNVARARQLYDASTVADPKHAAAWHGWGLLEKQQDNVLRARDIWLKARPALSGGACNPAQHVRTWYHRALWVHIHKCCKMIMLVSALCLARDHAVSGD